MRPRAVAFTKTLVVFASCGLLVACAAQPPAKDKPSPSKGSSEVTSESAPPPAAGLRLAPGFYKLEDGTAQALGTLEWRDLEGGFWVLTNGTGGDAETIAVIANGQYFQRRLEPLKGKQVLVSGKPLEGASTRMSGPEIEITSVEEVSDTPGAAE